VRLRSRTVVEDPFTDEVIGPLVEVNGGSDSTRRGIVPKKTMEKVSKLVEVVRACQVNILLDLYFSTF
jgi:hypothetical protein